MSYKRTYAVETIRSTHMENGIDGKEENMYENSSKHGTFRTCKQQRLGEHEKILSGSDSNQTKINRV